MNAGPRFWAVIPAAGIGSRMLADRPKQYLALCGRTVIEHTLERFLRHPRICGIVVALGAQDRYWEALPVAADAHIRRVDGGRERCHSVLNALEALRTAGGRSGDWVLVHDAARPCVRKGDIDRLIETCVAAGSGGILGVPVRDTIKQAAAGPRVGRTVDRAGLWHALTPQMFRLQALADALRAALADGYEVTDESSAIEHVGGHPLLVEGHADNIKITRPEDLALAEFHLSR